jgi:hypothetical protein
MPHTKPWVIAKQFSLCPHCIEEAFGGGWVVETNIGVYINQIFASLRGPYKINWQEAVPA